MHYKIRYSDEYQEWFQDQSLKSRLQITDRLDRIRFEGHFGKHKAIDDVITELKWENGRRIYYAYAELREIILLIGGNKNGQSKNIRQAKSILEKNLCQSR